MLQLFLYVCPSFFEKEGQLYKTKRQDRMQSCLFDYEQKIQQKYLFGNEATSAVNSL